MLHVVPNNVAIHLIAHLLQDDEESGSQPDTNVDDPFAKFNLKESTWTPPDGEFSAIDHYVDSCHRAVNAVNFKAKSQQNNLSPGEKAALLSLSRRSDIIIKPSDKGGAVVVWSRLYTSLKPTANWLMGDFTNTSIKTPLKRTSVQKSRRLAQ